MNISKNRQVAVVGSSDVDCGSASLASEVGRTVAAVGAVLICGGLGGTMEAAARGAKERGGTTVGIVPSYQKDTANPYIDIIIASGMGHARNVLVAASGDLVVALPGSHGTRSEVSLALKMGRPVIGVTAWGDVPQVKVVNSIQELEMELCLFFGHSIST